MAHINELYEVQAKQLLHKLCDALGIEDADRTKSGIEQAITRIKRLGTLDQGAQCPVEYTECELYMSRFRQD